MHLLLPRSGPVLALAGCAVVVLLLLRRPSPSPDDGPAEVRIKGQAILHIYQQTATGSAEVRPGDRIPPGTGLRFAIDLPAAGHVSVLGTEVDGKLYTAWPLNSEQSTQRPAGLHQALPGAVALDDPGEAASLFLVYCPLSAGAPQCRPGGGPGADPICQPGCTVTRRVLERAAPPTPASGRQKP